MLPILWKFSKIITFLKKLQQNCHNVMISTKIYIKIAFFNSKHCKQYKNTKKSFNLFLKLVKIINFLIKKWKNEIFSKILKIGTFTKTWIKFLVFEIFSPNFFYKIWMECRYEKCPKTWFLLKNWSNYEHVKHAKIKKHPV